MSAAAIDAAPHHQASDVIDGDRGGAQHGGANAFAEGARLGNDADNDKFGRGVTHEPQLRQRLLKAWIVRRQTKLGPAGQKVVFAVDAQCSRLLFLMRLNRICDYDQIRAVQIRSEIQPRRAEVENFNVRAAFVLATKLFNGQGAETVIAHQHVSQPYYAHVLRSWQRGASRRVHKTFT